MAEPITGRKGLKTGIRVGRVLMFIGCILFFFNALTNFLDFIVACLYQPLRSIPELTEMMDASYGAVWTDPINIIKYCCLPLIVAFLIVAGIGGISWLRDEGPFINVAPLMAMISLVLVIANFYLDIRHLINSGWDWVRFLLDLLDIQLTCGIYFIGWFLAKNQLD